MPTHIYLDKLSLERPGSKLVVRQANKPFRDVVLVSDDDNIKPTKVGTFNTTVSKFDFFDNNKTYEEAVKALGYDI